VRFEFTAGRPNLDFLATLAGRGTVDEERLQTPQDLTDWIAESGIVDSAPPVDQSDLERTRALREAIARTVGALVNGARVPDTDRALVNTAAALPQPHLRLENDGLHRTGGVEAVLAVLARDCLDLHQSPDRSSLRRCADPGCSRVFVDRSRGQRRRWCGMKGCGDRAKAAAYRQRQRTANEPKSRSHPVA
jgi:predicted RNA-binding Zn ribbon-like protein